MRCAVIMAGGRGTRFWPLSTEEKPKQFLKLVDEKTMLQMTVDRIKDLIPEERIFVVTGEKYEDLIKEQLPNIPARNIILEPVGRNTAPCIGLAAMVVKKYYPDSNLVILPSDHLIVDVKKFREIIEQGEEFVNNNKQAIITLGITPNRPETGYGYIHFHKDNVFENSIVQIKSVNQFVEKPNLQLALQYLHSGDYLWNSGMFIWNAQCIEDLIKKFLPNTYEILNSIVGSENINEQLKNKYMDVDNISVDFAIMEKYNEIFVIPSNFGWDDIGTWAALERYREKDNNNNILSGNVNVIECNNNVVFVNDKKINLVDVDNLFIVENDEMILITQKANMEKVKDMNEIISTRGE